MAVTAMNSAIFWDMMQCSVIELPTISENVVHPSSGVKSPENGSVSMYLPKCTLNHRRGRWSYSVQVQLQWTYTNQSQIRPTLFQITNLMHNSFILQQYICYIIFLDMFRAVLCSSSG